MKGESAFSVSTTLRSLPRQVRGLPFEEVKNAVLGKKYELSLALIGSTLSRKLNSSYRGKDKPANVLSFPLDKEAGEIFIDLSRAQSEAKKFDKTFADFVLYLFIHGTLHLKGMEHGATMERAENKYLQQFQSKKFNGPTNRNRN